MDHSDLPVSIEDLRRHGVSTFASVATATKSNRSRSRHVQEKRHQEEEELHKVNSRVRKYSPRLRLTMYARGPTAAGHDGQKIAKKQAWLLR